MAGILFTVLLSSYFFMQTASALPVVATITVGPFPFAVAHDPGKGETFVTNLGTNSVSVINDGTNTVVATITDPSFNGPQSIAYDSAKGEIFVANSNGVGTVSIINDSTNAVVAVITVGSTPTGVAYDSVKGEIFVVNAVGNTVSVINDSTNTVVSTITSPSFNGPFAVAYDSAKGEMFVTNMNTVSVIDDASNTVVATITDPSFNNTWGVAYDSAKGEIFVVNDGVGTVSVINDGSNTVVATVTVSTNPTSIAFDSVKNEMFASNNGANSVSVINDTTNVVSTTVTVGTHPQGVAYDSADGEIFVVNNSNPGTVSVISDTVPLTPPPSPPPSSGNSTSSSGNSSPSPGGHDVTIYHPPSLGNDYHNHYAGGFEFNGKSFDITKYGITIPQQSLKIGQPANFTFKIYDERGGSTISHVGMYLHSSGYASVANSDTSIVWDKRDNVTVNDPAKFFTNATVMEHHDNNFAYVSIKFTPVKTMPDSAIVMRMWDLKLASVDVPINGAIIIIDPNAPVQITKVPSDQYGDYHTLVNLLDSDGYQLPTILNKIKNSTDLSSSIDIHWIYDKGTDNLTMVETFKDGKIIGSITTNLFKKPIQPTLTDHNYTSIPEQNNRQDPEQEQVVMHQEETKAKNILESIFTGTYHHPER